MEEVEVAGVVVDVRGWEQQTWPRVQNLRRLNTPAPSVMMSPARQRLLDTQVQLVVEDPGTMEPTYLSRTVNMSGRIIMFTFITIVTILGVNISSSCPPLVLA